MLMRLFVETFILDSFSGYIKTLLKGTGLGIGLTFSLLCSVTQKLHHTLGSGDGRRNKHNTSAKVFPSLPGSHLHLNNPALEFVKTVCKVRNNPPNSKFFDASVQYVQVLSLDSSTRHQVAKLRYSMITII